ncbi:MAG: hypothetical protein IT366_18515 [Candidatus Hydrogenedentes bacterium]|nr:hypothetical protein [Candidatus Hydrogenedentota bacterium]
MIAKQINAFSERCGRRGNWRGCNPALPFLAFLFCIAQNAYGETFRGAYFSGEGDVGFIQLLDTSRRMFDCDPEFQNLSMLYMPTWNGLVEGPTWGAWWIQNSYGTTYCALPFLQEPFTTFLQNSQDLWFSQMGDGKRAGYKDWVAPDGCLCDAASPGWIVYKQGDGRTDIHDWGMEFTAAGVVLQSELLLIGRDAKAISHYLPMLERSANFIESRRDPEKDLFLAGPAGNLLAPSYAGWKRPDGTYDKAYLTGLSITYIAALDRLIELEKLAGTAEKVTLYTDRRDRARNGLKHVTTEEGYFIKSLDPDGTRHGVYGAEKHGYFETSPNHDAIAFRVVDDAQANRIYEKIASIPLLRRHDIIIANEPGLDDMYESPTSWLWQHGTWVNGGHWSTCEARMDLAYFRLGKYKDARRAVNHMMRFAREFRLDNPLVDFGNAVYQPKEPYNLCYDSFGPMAGIVRGLFEYLYTADSLTIVPHIPTGITQLVQEFPIRFGSKQLFLRTAGQGPITSVTIDGNAWTEFDAQSVRLPYDAIADTAIVAIGLGGNATDSLRSSREPSDAANTAPAPEALEKFAAGTSADARKLAERISRFASNCKGSALRNTYEASHAKLAVDAINAIAARARLGTEGKLAPLQEPTKTAAEKLYVDTAMKLCQGLEKTLNQYESSSEPGKAAIYREWIEAKQ